MQQLELFSASHTQLALLLPATPADPLDAAAARLALPENMTIDFAFDPHDLFTKMRRHLNWRNSSVMTRENEWWKRKQEGVPDKYASWAEAEAAGLSYMGGRLKPSQLNEWQQAAFMICCHLPNSMIVVEFRQPRLTYHIKWRGEFVKFSLPYHGEGGEKDWITRNGKTKYLVNVD